MSRDLCLAVDFLYNLLDSLLDLLRSSSDLDDAQCSREAAVALEQAARRRERADEGAGLAAGFAHDFDFVAFGGGLGDN